jgi:UDP-N-acetylmuramate dehydrogenase
VSDVADRIDAAAAVLGPLAQRDVPLGPMTTYRVGGSASLFARPGSVDELLVVGEACRVSGLPVLVVGRGSNLLVADAGFRGVAVSLADLHAGIEIDGSVVRAGGAVALPVLARRTVAASLTGFEWAVGVPGSVGGGVRMNAGGHGSDMAANLHEVDLVDLVRGERRVVPAAGLGLRFRGSDVADHQVVVEATLVLAPGDRARSEAELDEVVRWRREHQPGGQNAGSVFVNPVPGEVPAGALIDRVGLRGVRLRTAHVSDKHANFIQADEGGSAEDVRELIELVRDRVAAETGYVMRSEVKLVGFDDSTPGADAGPGTDAPDGAPDDAHAPAGVRW